MSANILVVDDEKGIRYTFNRFLSEEGYNVVTAEDFDGALSYINEMEFDIVFVDIILGGKTGIDVLREIKKKGQRCPVIVITGAPDIETASEALRLGAFDFITKPVVQDALIRTAKIALKNKRLSDDNERYRLNLEAIYSSVKEAIITVDRNLTVIELNDSARDICGLTREHIGKEFRILQKDCTGNCLNFIRQTLETMQPVEARHMTCKCRNNIEMVLDITTSPLHDHNNEFSGAVLVVSDSTRLSRMEKDLKERQGFYKIVGQNQNMQKLYSLIENLANVQSTVLITGESGTGKELVAEALHHRGNRNSNPLVKVNCSALQEQLLESELFGHVKGAFTDAHTDKEGRFQKADGGTIFLDEIGDISPRIQLRLLRVLQDMEFEKVGDSTPIRVDVRVVAATNQDINEKVRLGEFRKDLYYRLNVVEMHVPPLRERTDDIPLLVDHFIEKLNRKLNKQITSASSDVMNIFMLYSWPGNIRELEHAIEHAIIVSTSSIINLNNLPSNLTAAVSIAPSPSIRNEGREEILQALRKTAWNKAKAARLLGISRQTFYRKIKKYNIGDAPETL
jgi:PAS domain S-box-containing protein